MLVIFDCDGVLVDSEMISNQVAADLLTEHGHPTTIDQSRTRYIGLSTTSLIKIVNGTPGPQLPENFGTLFHDRTIAALTANLKPIPGILKTLDRLKHPTCVASSGTPDKINNSLKVTGLANHFATDIYSAVQVSNGKPAPDLFLFSAAQMNESPDNCIVIEDSVAGITAAKAAGMKAFGFTGGSHAGAAEYADGLRTAGADLIFRDMQTLPELLIQNN